MKRKRIIIISSLLLVVAVFLYGMIIPSKSIYGKYELVNFVPDNPIGNFPTQIDTLYLNMDGTFSSDH